MSHRKPLYPTSVVDGAFKGKLEGLDFHHPARFSSHPTAPRSMRSPWITERGIGSTRRQRTQAEVSRRLGEC
ncbi:uncharacterized protein LACBIDRAFT_299423 [Laccaria bicolor S238N-H82]|uniref:Predicted protein n=1 Tax=Laccaria bicolor (strain S238N-H82 / ATCC MYA-4686) TaxID=486041 RepID=B0DEN5_LACBS|nr:uncharacterized protein LACBIDRAFT_299423 [Laccaria bicolor S238N-H82]EDR06970.1 predicted protein [Laccaria bicolor S238N-H82]|eukprot:XP_001882343.1 predicted protein [Laccaria bicolor S238N-H82]